MDGRIPRIVILGAGFGGVSAAKTIGRLSRRRLYAVTVIDRSPVHQFTPLFYELATAFTEHGRIGSSRVLRQGIAVDNATLLAQWGADFLQAEVAGIDWDAREVLTDARRVPFDYIIIALGSEIAYYGIPGIQEHAFVMKTVEDADSLRRRVHGLLHARERRERAGLDIIVGGGGATGVEFATEVTMYIRKHLMKGHLGAQDFSVRLVEGGPRILRSLDQRLSAAAERRLEALGIGVYTDTVIESVDKTSAIVNPRKPGEGEVLHCRLSGRTTFRADLVVWTGGVKGSAALARLGVPTEGRGGTILTDDTFAVAGKKDAYAIGDAIDLRDPRTGAPVPWLAPVAIRMGKVAGKIVAHRASGMTSDLRHLHKKYPVVVTLGGKFGVAELGPFRFIGFVPWLLRKAADIQYFMSILPPLTALRMWWRGVQEYARND